MSVLLSHTLSGPRYPAASAARPPVVALQRVLHLVRIQRRRCRRQLPSRGVQLLRDHHRRAKDSDDGTCVGSERVQRSLPKHPAHHCGGEGAQGAEEAVRRHRRGPHRPPSEQDVHQGREHEGDDACDRAARTMMCVAMRAGAGPRRRRRQRRRGGGGGGGVPTLSAPLSATRNLKSGSDSAYSRATSRPLSADSSRSKSCRAAAAP